MISQKSVETARTKWAAAIVFVLCTEKKNGSLRFRVNYQKLNAVTKQEFYLIL